LGVVGPVYPIAEQDMLANIEQRLDTMQKSGERNRIESDAKARYLAYVERPAGINLPRATQTKTHYIDPTLTLPYDIKDDRGRILYPAGTTVNPLDYLPLPQQLVFFDGDDPAQVKWAKLLLDKNPAHVKPILVNGPVLDLMKEWKIRVYYDQRGRLVRRFVIKSVPATVSQDGKRLKVVEHGPVIPN